MCDRFEGGGEIQDYRSVSNNIGYEVEKEISEQTRGVFSGHITQIGSQTHFCS